MSIEKSKHLTIFIVLLGCVSFSSAYAQPVDDRWKTLLPGYLVDTKTFEAITVNEGVNKGKRWINAWIQWQSSDKSTVRVRMGAMCEDRYLQITEFVSFGADGKETYEKQFKELPVVPNGEWEPLHSELCKRGKQWWKVW